MLKRIIILLLACPAFLNASAQNIAQLQYPQIIPPSPDAAALGKYGQIPVDKSTGVPSISVPLYEIKTPRFSVPISLSYHASGIRVDEIASWAGLGWSLNAGGVITRSVMGLPDEGPNGFLYDSVPSAANIQWPRDSTYVQTAILSGWDTQPDNYFYNFNDQSGAFVWGINRKPVLIPYKAVQISYDTASGFHIIDEQGNHYTFNSTERVTSTIGTSIISPVSSWYLTQMISADFSDTVQFIYKKDSLAVNDYSFSFTQNIGPQWTASSVSLPTNDWLYPIVPSSSERTYVPVRISSIVFKGGKVDFIGKSGRLDNANISLDSVIVSNYTGATGQYTRLKSFKLLTNYFYSTIPNPLTLGSDEPSKHRLILTGLVENDQKNTPVKTHQFAYNQTMLPPVHNFAQDQWGYYNGQTGNQTLLQDQEVVEDAIDVFDVGAYNGQPGANRNVVSSSAQAGMLTSITYPTKGYTVFNYESNQEAVSQQSTFQLGSEAIGYYTESSIQPYTPTSAELASGGYTFQVHVQHPVDPTYTDPINPYVELIQVSNGTIMYSATAIPNADLDTTVVIPLVAGQQYQLVAIAQGGTSTSNTALLPKASITTSYLAPTGSVNTPVGGIRIASIQNFGSDSTLLSTETYQYGINGGGNLLSGSFMTNKISHICYFMMAPCPGCGPTGQVAPGTLTTYANSSVYQLASLSGSPVGYGNVGVYHGTLTQNTGLSVYTYSIWADSILFCPGVYMNGIKLIPITWKNGDPIAEDHYRNTGNGGYTLEQEKQYTYNYISRTNGRGLMLGDAYESMGTAFYSVWPYLNPTDFYWFDYPISTGVRVPSQTVVNDYDSTGVAILMTDTTNYFYDDSTLFMPTRTLTADSKGHSILTYAYRPLDLAAINSRTPLSATATAAVDSMVSRNMISPVLQQVEYRNGSLTELSLTNYQIWSPHVIAPQNIQIQLAPNPIETRLQYNAYDANGNVLELQKANDVKEAYLWGYNNLYPVAKILNTTNAIAKTYITQSVLDFPTSDAALRTQLNNLRTIPGALVTTLTYNPLVGMTSQTDAQGKIVYYDYDSLQRLKDIKDVNGNIVKTLDYHYKGQ